jgi:hypothetical protein
MSYMHIELLYRPEAQKLLLFKQVWALEKVHGSSSHVGWKTDQGVRFSAGGASQHSFEACFDLDDLRKRFLELGQDDVVVYGEAYGGSMQKMKATYGDKLRFVAFEVKFGDQWLTDPEAAEVAAKLGLDFVPYRLVPATVEALDAERDRPSEQAVKLGMGEGHLREGIVIRPPFECTDSYGNRLIAKHKGDAFAERLHVPKAQAGASLEVMQGAEAIAREWATPMRLEHVLDALGITDLDPKRTGDVIKGMVDDIQREAAGEIEWSKEVAKAIGATAARLYKAAQQASLQGN